MVLKPLPAALANLSVSAKAIEAGKCVLVRRDTSEKIECAISDVAAKVSELLPAIQNDMFERAKKHLETHTFAATNKEEFEEAFKETKGFVKAMWCGCRECEEKVKEEFNATSRCIPFEQEKLSDTCVMCGKPATKMVYWGRAY